VAAGNTQAVKSTRRRISNQEKLRILREIDSLAHGELGAYLRREGLYYAMVARWRKERDAGVLVEGQEKKRGRRVTRTAESKELEKIKRENERLKVKLEHAQLIIEAQKKIAALLAVSQNEPEEES
jgi:transposase-like protein